jgi:hypothetical protein
MKIEFVKRENGPERLECEAEVVFEEGDGFLAGLRLVGFSLWRSPEGEVYVTFPSRAFGAGSDRKYFDYLREQTFAAGSAKTLKGFICDSYLASKLEDALQSVAAVFAHPVPEAEGGAR